MLLPDGKVRKLRRSVDEPGQAHELTFSCFARRPMLARDHARKWVIEALDRARREQHFDLWAYVIMPEHVHVLLLPRLLEYRIASILRAIKQSVSRRAVRYLREYAPERLEHLKVAWPTGRSEYRFWQQDGGYDRNFVNIDALRKVVDYIHNNPVRRGLAGCGIDGERSSGRWYAGVMDVVLDMDSCPSGKMR